MSMRTRTRNQGNVSCRFYATRPIGGDFVVFRSYPALRYQLSSITDNEDGKDRRFKPCLHTADKDTPSYDVGQHQLDQNLAPGGLATMFATGNLGSHLANVLNVTQTLEVLGTPTLATVSSQVLYDLFTRCLPSLNNGNSLVNFVLELRDVRSLTRTIANLRRLVSQTARRASKLRSASVDLTSSAAEVHLSYQFGVAPFIRDVKKLFKTAQTLEKRIEWLESNHSKVLVRHSRMLLQGASFAGGDQVIEPSAMTTYYSGPWGGGNVLRRRSRRFLVPPTLHGTLKYSYALTSTTPLKNQLRTYLNAFGVEANPKIVWDAIPFSFLIDWVVDIGSLLGSFKIDSLGIQTTVIDYCYSIKWHAVCDIDISEYNPYRLSQTPYKRVRQVERYYYERKVGTPSLSAVNVSGLGSREFLLGGSLVLAGKWGRTSGRAKLPSFK